MIISAIIIIITINIINTKREFLVKIGSRPSVGFD